MKEVWDLSHRLTYRSRGPLGMGGEVDSSETVRLVMKKRGFSSLPSLTDSIRLAHLARLWSEQWTLQKVAFG